MKTDLENLANHIAEYGREPHTLQVETKCGKSWMTVYDTLAGAVRELIAVQKHWGVDAIAMATVALLSTPSSDDPVVSVDEGGASSVGKVAAATGDSVEETQKLLVKPTRRGVGGKID